MTSDVFSKASCPTSQFSWWTNFFVPVISFILFGTSYAVLALFFRRFLLPLLVIALGIASFFIFFDYSHIYLAVALLLIAVMIINFYRMQRQKDLLIKVAPDKILKVGLPFVMTLLVLLSTLVYFNAYKANADKVTFQIPDGVYNFVTPYIEGMLSEQVPEYDSDMTTEEYLENYALTEIFGSSQTMFFKGESNDTEEPGFLAIPELSIPEIPGMENIDTDVIAHDIERELEGEMIKEFNHELLKQFGVETANEEPIINLIHDVINGMFDSVLSPLKAWLPYILAFGSFIWLKLLSIVVVWLIYPIAILKIKIAKRLNIIEISKIKREQERITIK